MENGSTGWTDRAPTMHRTSTRQRWCHRETRVYQRGEELTNRTVAQLAAEWRGIHRLLLIYVSKHSAVPEGAPLPAISLLHLFPTTFFLEVLPSIRTLFLAVGCSSQQWWWAANCMVSSNEPRSNYFIDYFDFFFQANGYPFWVYFLADRFSLLQQRCRYHQKMPLNEDRQIMQQL